MPNLNAKNKIWLKFTINYLLFKLNYNWRHCSAISLTVVMLCVCTKRVCVCDTELVWKAVRLAFSWQSSALSVLWAPSLGFCLGVLYIYMYGILWASSIVYCLGVLYISMYGILWAPSIVCCLGILYISMYGIIWAPSIVYCLGILYISMYSVI